MRLARPVDQVGKMGGNNNDSCPRSQRTSILVLLLVPVTAQPLSWSLPPNERPSAQLLWTKRSEKFDHIWPVLHCSCVEENLTLPGIFLEGVASKFSILLLGSANLFNQINVNKAFKPNQCLQSIDCSWLPGRAHVQALGSTLNCSRAWV